MTKTKRKVLVRVNRNSLFGYFLFDFVYTTSDYYTRHLIYYRTVVPIEFILLQYAIYRYILKCINLILEYNTYALR